MNEHFDPRLRVNYRTDTVRDDSQSMPAIYNFKEVKSQIPSYTHYSSYVNPTQWTAEDQILQNNYQRAPSKSRIDCNRRILKGADEKSETAKIQKRLLSIEEAEKWGELKNHEIDMDGAYQYNYSCQNPPDIYYSPDQMTFSSVELPTKESFDPLGIKAALAADSSAAVYDQINRTITFNPPTQFNYSGQSTRNYNSTAQTAYDPSIPSDGISERTNAPKDWVDQSAYWRQRQRPRANEFSLPVSYPPPYTTTDLKYLEQITKKTSAEKTDEQSNVKLSNTFEEENFSNGESDNILGRKIFMNPATQGVNVLKNSTFDRGSTYCPPPGKSQPQPPIPEYNLQDPRNTTLGRENQFYGVTAYYARDAPSRYRYQRQPPIVYDSPPDTLTADAQNAAIVRHRARDTDPLDRWIKNKDHGAGYLIEELDWNETWVGNWGNNVYPTD